MPEETLTAKLKFDGDAAIRGMKRAERGLKGMAQGAAMARRGVQNLRAGMAGARMAQVALAGGAVIAVKKFTDFERQFGGVKAVLTEGQKQFFPALRKEAELLGATTSFSAVQAAEAMENLARAGMKPQEIIAAIQPTLAAAAAEGMELGAAADIVASNMKAFGLEAKDAAMIADTLAFVSAKTNTNMQGLQEGLKFAAPVARSLGIDLKDTAATLGLFADVGLKGSLAGTGFKNAMLKIAKAARSGKVRVGGFTAAVVNNVDAQNKVIGVNLEATMGNIVRTLAKIKDPLKRTSVGMKLLGLRGIGAATAFEAMTEEKAEILFSKLRKDAKGTATAMAKMRLDNIHGDFVRLTSAVEGFSIKIGEVLAPTVRRFAKDAQVFLGDAAKAFTALTSDSEEGLKGLNKTAVEFARGFKQGIEGAKSILSGFWTVLKGVVTFVRSFFTPSSGLGPEGPAVQGTIQFAIKLGAVAIGLKTVGGLLSRMGRIAVGTFQLIGGVLKSIKPAIQGTVGFLTKRLPTLGRVLPRGLARLTGAVSAAEKITAQPVRVVNWDEAGMAGPMGAGPAAAAAPGAAVPRKTFGQLSKLGKAATVLGGAFAATGALLVGWQLGRAIDETTGLSDKLAEAATLLDWRKQAEMKRVKEVQQAGVVAAAGGEARELAKKWLKFSEMGIKVQGDIGQKKVAVTRALAERKIRERFRMGGISPAQIDEFIRNQKATLDKLPTLAQLTERPTQFTLRMDGRVIANIVAEREAAKFVRLGKPRKGEVIPGAATPRTASKR